MGRGLTGAKNFPPVPADGVLQQVIVLATTSEIDELTFRFMETAVSRAYLLAVDRIATQVTEQPLAHPTVMLNAIQ